MGEKEVKEPLVFFEERLRAFKALLIGTLVDAHRVETVAVRDSEAVLLF